MVATGTGTAALHIALLAAGVKPGDEVITPAHNFVADHQAILACGAQPVLCDVADDDLGLDPAKCAELVGPRTRAHHPPALRGHPVPHRRRSWTSRGARAAGGGGRHARLRHPDRRAARRQLRGHRLLQLRPRQGHHVDRRRAAWSRLTRTTSRPCTSTACSGIDKDTTERYKNARAWDYDVVSAGFRYHLTNVLASIGLSQLAHVAEFIANRQAYCRRYSERLAGVPEVRTPMSDYVASRPSSTMCACRRPGGPPSSST